MPKKELSGIQLIRTFIERRVQPLAARAHCMCDYTDRRDPMIAIDGAVMMK
jgi:hypothetical protein